MSKECVDIKILVTGAKGQLGTDIMQELTARGISSIGVDIDGFDITDRQAVSDANRLHQPNVVIHCAAHTAVDKAEDEPELCRQINEEGTRNIALACKETGAKMLYISTDYVFEGNGSHFHKPHDPTNPLSVYGKTKLDGEIAVQEILDKFFIVRISWVFGQHGNNFVKTMLRLGKERDSLNVVCDQIGSPTYTVDLAKLLCDMAVSEKYGVYHATNEGVCSWAEFAEEIFRQAGMDVVVNRIAAVDYPVRARRPYNSRLSKDCLDEVGFDRLPEWKDALTNVLVSRSKHLAKHEKDSNHSQ